MGENFFPIIFYSFYIFEGNYIEFKRTIEDYLETANRDEFLSDNENHVSLHISGGREIGRRIHNYAAAWLSLIDHTRIVHGKLKDHTSADVRDFANAYEARLAEYLKDTFENVFVKDLRRYVQHKKVPVPTLYFKMHRIKNLSSESRPPLFKGGYSFEFNSKDIEDFNWSRQPREYIKSNKSVPIAKIIDKHFSIMKDFYLWIQFRDHQLYPYASSEVKEITFEEWKQKTLGDEV
ncbi:hypothetical protein H6F90_06740 [Trichocoleus sp. FACHB-591]|uniref:hypothetical protein n=1 Tax=Trichocoleus sp. FACHB-591 TaxID=2692872 RepID=UPI001688F4C3|nr:hypothetical protein [Trichocoleus sp. FACHB-591]MBD2094849.1 hypothetical protein [Trichocoleus sp. FACHB-591]